MTYDAKARTVSRDLTLDDWAGTETLAAAAATAWRRRLRKVFAIRMHTGEPMEEGIAPEEATADLYRSGRYIEHNPSLHEEESPWKVTKITPLIDQFIALRSCDAINLLDVGGGAGLILKGVADHIRATSLFAKIFMGFCNSIGHFSDMR